MTEKAFIDIKPKDKFMVKGLARNIKSCNNGSDIFLKVDFGNVFVVDLITKSHIVIRDEEIGSIMELNEDEYKSVISVMRWL